MAKRSKRVRGAAGRVGCRRLESYPSAYGGRQNAQRPVSRRKRRHGADRHAASASLADAVDFNPTGNRPLKHGIDGFSEPARDGRGVQLVTNLSRKSKALWNILNQNGLRSIVIVVIGWWPSHPAEPIDGVMVSDHYHRAYKPVDEGWPLPANAVHPPGT